MHHAALTARGPSCTHVWYFVQNFLHSLGTVRHAFHGGSFSFPFYSQNEHLSLTLTISSHSSCVSSESPSLSVSSSPEYHSLTESNTHRAYTTSELRKIRMRFLFFFFSFARLRVLRFVPALCIYHASVTGTPPSSQTLSFTLFLCRSPLLPSRSVSMRTCRLYSFLLSPRLSAFSYSWISLISDGDLNKSEKRGTGLRLSEGRIIYVVFGSLSCPASSFRGRGEGAGHNICQVCPTGLVYLFALSVKPPWGLVCTWRNLRLM